MTDTNPPSADFMAQVQATQTLWALQDQASEGWVVLDSINFENADVMPVWSSIELAKSHCVDEWKDYVPMSISLADWLEFWVEDLAEDNVLIGVEWRDGGEYIELELVEFSQMVAKLETL
ncbi:DUF2750 domain-containing protein [Paraglaciecola psychrophila]|jgi:hypothetical protein|uniref:DUF2750 domain-containing protein n=1 Tax=Paraglaciecola psychrophila 170 TaxID=1129794 RepID=K7A8E8_9ALTE|nr:DUF2750 domain-containing protein [Paraglaciecola psychrophila]AGH43310.1 hypothetical protein C427_1201 [Paraglaciecola psychrophila 170]GAC37038.1 hypothetical protein GPSY_1403 [Paraglaciecola psychrophila 170]